MMFGRPTKQPFESSFKIDEVSDPIARLVPRLGQRLQRSYVFGLARGLKNVIHFKNELLLAAGLHPNAGCSSESICVVAVHKAASTLMPLFIKELRPQLAGRLPVDIEGFIWAYMDEDPTSAMERLAHRLHRPTGLIYVPFRKALWQERFANTPIIAIVRDPRDVLVSLWYSHAFSHAFPYHPGRIREFRVARALALQSSPATYWRVQLEFVIDSLESIAGLTTRNSRVTVLRYEDMLSDFDSWATQFLEALQVEHSPALIHRLRTISQVDSPARGRRGDHIRKKVPGQYLQEWSLYTVEDVSARLRPVLQRFGYL
jgi:hypothetical protein